MVSSASWSRRRSSSMAVDDRCRRFFLAIDATVSLGTDVEAHKNTLFVRHVADQPAKGRWQALDEGRRGNNQVAARERQVLVDVHDLEVVQTLQVLLTNAPDVLNRSHRSTGGAGHVQAKQISC